MSVVGQPQKEVELNELKKGERDSVRPCCICTQLLVPWPWKMRAAISKQTQARLAAQAESLLRYSELIERMTWSLHSGLVPQAFAQ